jgi:hypothetical protein
LPGKIAGFPGVTEARDMRNRLRTYLERCVALMVVAGIATFGAWLIDALLCLVRGCAEDDASRRANAIIGAPAFVAYVVVTWGAVFLPAIALRQRLSKTVAAATPATAVAAGLSYLFFDPGYDDLEGAMGLALWFATPWFIANLTGLAIWPNPAARPATVDVDCFD